MKLKSALIIITFLSSLFTITSCRKKKDTFARITVVTQGGATVAGKAVRLEPNCSACDGSIDEDLRRIQITDDEGVASFDYSDHYKLGQNGLFIMSVTVGEGNEEEITTAEAKGVIEVKEEETNELTVALPY